ncbi:T9SS type A sorting domain-containing protein [Dokdonia ponticola]|uniref:T9SS type A sorting domain-containing protein n=1 Tax=Dokdonia ponticola TaxID=2041041 RepID=A0ABV9HRK8_9FLAO
MLFFITIFLISHAVVAQFEEQQIISTTTSSPYIAQPYDIDNDGAMDVLVAFGENLSLSWFRNTDGLGTFSEEILINSNPVLYLSIHFTDIDTDGDRDILFIENNPRRLVWLENTDGEGTFGPEQEIAEEDYIDSVVPMDFDNDGDIDLISSYTDTFTDTIRWYENIDGSGVFSEPELLFDNLSRLSKLVIADINNDTFEDILTSHENEGPATIIWYQNTGNASFQDATVLHQYDYFTEPTVSDQTSVYELQFADINNDDLKDVVFIAELDFPEFYYRKLSWLENLDNMGNFGVLVDIFEDTFDVYRFFDIDDDGDNDIIKYFRNFDQISWIEYDQDLAAFTTERVITTEVDFTRNVQAADFNNDGLLDIVSASSGDDKVAWYLNTGTLSIQETKVSPYTITPNPVNNLLTITGEKDITTVTVYTLTGQELTIEIENNTIDVSQLPAGYYFLNIQNTALFSKTITFIKK